MRMFHQFMEVWAQRVLVRHMLRVHAQLKRREIACK